MDERDCLKIELEMYPDETPVESEMMDAFLKCLASSRLRFRELSDNHLVKCRSKIGQSLSLTLNFSLPNDIIFTKFTY